MHIEIYIIDYNILEINNNWWKNLLFLFLEKETSFYISHWAKDKDTIKKALGFGKLYKESSWESFLVCSNCKDFVSYINSFKPYYDLEEACLKYSDFFTINIQPIEINKEQINFRFSSSHYGTEVYISYLNKDEVEKIKNIILPIKDYFIFRIYDNENMLVEEYQTWWFVAANKLYSFYIY